MSGYRFERADGELDCDAWRALDRAVYRWVRSHGGDALLAGVAAWTSLAEGQGDAALSLRAPRYGMAPLDAAHLAALRDSPWVATRPEHGQRPFALDAAGRFQLWRNHAHELAIARHVQARRAGAPMSALVTQTTSGSSMMPAFMNCRLSPEPGWMHRITVSAIEAMSPSDWPMPTLSTMTRSWTARISTTAATA